MLIPSPRHTARDLAYWADQEAADRVLAQTKKLEAYEARALDALRSFALGGPFFVGVSWGKDSVAVLHLAWRLAEEGIRPAAIWFPAGRIENPDCALVRDAFLARWPVDYREIEAGPAGDVSAVDGHDGAQAEFERASRRAGGRYASGVRADESGVRRRRMQHWGENSINTCAPIGWWPTEYVFAYAAKYDLPLHPLYACSKGGLFERNRLRVGTVGGYRGTEHGRREIETAYYPEMFRANPDLSRHHG